MDNLINWVYYCLINLLCFFYCFYLLFYTYINKYFQDICKKNLKFLSEYEK